MRSIKDKPFFFRKFSSNQSIMRSFPQLNSAGTKIIHLINTCTSQTQIHQIQTQLILQNLHSNTIVAHHFINACESLGLLNSALTFFTHLPKPHHVFIFNLLLRAFSHSHTPHIPLYLYTHLHKHSISPTHFTFPFILKSLSDFQDLRHGQCVHTHVVKLGFLNDIYVQNSLLNVYASCGKMNLCQQVFDEMPQRDVVSWTVLITGNRSVGRYDDALIAFEQMQYAGVLPNEVTMVNALAACASFGALEMGVWIHDFIRKNGWELDVVLGTSLIDMYGKCGRIEEGLNVFKSMRDKNVYTWNSVIRGLALAKSGEEAVSWFFRMEQEGLKADKVSLIAVLCACSHSGLVQIGRQIFDSLIDGKYGFSPGVKHYACMVDLLARAGCLQDAYRFIEQMPFESNKVIWGALLGGSRPHGNFELSELAAWKLVELAPENGAYYVILSNLYAEIGRWNDVAMVRKLMLERGLKKDLGSSSIEFEPKEIVYKLLAE